MTTTKHAKHKANDNTEDADHDALLDQANRFHLASLAMQGILSNNDLLKRCTTKQDENAPDVNLEDAVAEHAYLFADAMLKKSGL